MKFIAVAVAAVAALATEAAAHRGEYMWYSYGQQSQGCVQRGEYNKYTNSWGCNVAKCDYQQALTIVHTEEYYLQTQDNLCLVALNNKPGCKVVLQQCRKTPGCYWKKHNEYQYINEHGYCLHYQNGYLVQQACGKPTYTPQIWQCKPKPTPAPVPTVTTVTVAPAPTPAPCTCQQWNGQCYRGYQLIDRAWSVKCTGSQCAQVCCVPTPTPAPCTCQQWNGQCYRGYQLIDRAWSVKCTGSQCAQVCCVPTPVQYTCGDYFREYGRCDDEATCKPHHERCNWDGYFYSNKCRRCDEVCCSVRPPLPQPPVVPGPPEVILAPPVCGDWFTADPSNVCGVLTNAPAFTKCDATTGCDANQCCLQA